MQKYLVYQFTGVLTGANGGSIDSRHETAAQAAQAAAVANRSGHKPHRRTVYVPCEIREWKTLAELSPLAACDGGGDKLIGSAFAEIGSPTPVVFRDFGGCSTILVRARSVEHAEQILGAADYAAARELANPAYATAE